MSERWGGGGEGGRPEAAAREERWVFIQHLIDDVTFADTYLLCSMACAVRSRNYRGVLCSQGAWETDQYNITQMWLKIMGQVL